MKEVKLLANRKFAAFIPQENEAWEEKLRANPKLRYARMQRVLVADENDVEYLTVFPANRIKTSEIVSIGG